MTTLVQPALDKSRAAGLAVIQLLAGQSVTASVFESVLQIGNTTAAPQ